MPQLALFAVLMWAIAAPPARSETPATSKTSATSSARPAIQSHARPATQPPDFHALLVRHANLTYPELVKSLPERKYLEKLTFNPTKVKHYGQIAGHAGLTDTQQALFKRNGFVVLNRNRGTSFPVLYLQAYQADLPVLITTDSILHAMHRSYDDILKEMEETYLRWTLQTVLQSCHDELVARAGKDHGDSLDAHYRDVDLYLTVALSLLQGKPQASSLDQDEQVAQVLRVIASQKMQLITRGPVTSIYGGKRTLDASQFKPRGHYTKSETLKRYFQAMMWVSRADSGFNVLPAAHEAKSDPQSLRELRDAILLTELLVSTGAIKHLAGMDQIIEFMVGPSDNITPFALAKLLEKEGIKSLADLRGDAQAQRLQETIRAAGVARQKICSQVIFVEPYESRTAPLPGLFQFFGQRYAIDSFVLSQVVFDTIHFQGRKQQRKMSSGLDVMFALGNDSAAPLLAADLNKYNYAGNLRACREFVAGQAEPVWRSNLYNVWLDAIRALDDDPAGQPNIPQAMRTQAWQRKQLQTQLASWTELRHDNILYVKQSYGRHSECEYPGVYVEPYPNVYARIKYFCEEAALRIAAADVPVPARNKWTDPRERQVKFLQRMATIVGRLESLAKKELAAQPFTAEEQVWLKKVIKEHRCDSGDNTYDGWYCQLFYRAQEQDLIPWAPVVADVHSAPPVFGEDPLPGQSAVLEVGTGSCEYLVIAVDNGPDRMAYVGPVYSYFEFPWPADDRLTDEQWRQMLDQGQTSPAPTWTNAFLAGSETER